MRTRIISYTQHRINKSLFTCLRTNILFHISAGDIYTSSIQSSRASTTRIYTMAICTSACVRRFITATHRIVTSHDIIHFCSQYDRLLVCCHYSSFFQRIKKFNNSSFVHDCYFWLILFSFQKQETSPSIALYISLLSFIL